MSTLRAWARMTVAKLIDMFNTITQSHTVLMLLLCFVTPPVCLEGSIESTHGGNAQLMFSFENALNAMRMSDGQSAWDKLARNGKEILSHDKVGVPNKRSSMMISNVGGCARDSYAVIFQILPPFFTKQQKTSKRSFCWNGVKITATNI